MSLPRSTRSSKRSQGKRLQPKPLDRRSRRARLQALSPEKRREYVASLTKKERIALLYDWRGTWARDNQLEPEGDWLDWLLLAGRGFGKTRTAAQWCVDQMVAMPGSRGTIVAPTFTIGRDVCVEGESGILACAPPWLGAHFNRSLGELRTRTGCFVKVYSADAPDSLRGQQAHWMWAEELASWRKNWDAWDQAKFGLRLKWGGREGRCVVSTTPKPVWILRKLLTSRTSVVTRGTTYQNLHNLSAAYRELISKYAGTRLGRQELGGELLDDIAGALWNRAQVEACRVEMPPLRLEKNERGEQVEAFDLVRVVIGVDPATTSKRPEEGGRPSDETGIIVAGRGANGRFYLLEDASGIYSPLQWADKVAELYEFWKADRVIAEVNQGGDMVETVLRAAKNARRLPIRKVHASKGKLARAEPLVTAYERGAVHHVGAFPTLEDQLCTWVPGESDFSPDRLDAWVWAWTDLDKPARFIL